MSAPAPGDACRALCPGERESPLLWLRSRKDRNGRLLIDAAQFEAGERLRADYSFAQCGPRITASWSCLAPPNRGRRGASCQWCGPARCSSRCKGARAGKVVLQIALTQLAKHYGLIADTCRPRRDVRPWGEADYRPLVGGMSKGGGGFST